MANQPESKQQESLLTSLKTGDGCVIRRKEIYEYVTPDSMYDIELYENTDETFYAIGVPRGAERVVVYGSSIVSSRRVALQSLLDKIGREGIQQLFGQERSDTFCVDVEDDDNGTDTTDDDEESESGL